MTSAVYRENFKQIEWKPLPEEPRPPSIRPKRSSLVAPYIASDTMAPARHPLTGQEIDSKSRFSRITKEHGYIEIGNDPARLRSRPKPKPDRKAIRETIERSFARVKRGEINRRG